MPSLASDLIHVGLSPRLATSLGDIPIDAITAAGVAQATAYKITASINSITVCVAGVNDGVILPAITKILTSINDPTIYSQIVVRNDTAAIAQVYPDTGEAINALVANAPIALAAFSGKVFYKITTVRWVSVP